MASPQRDALTTGVSWEAIAIFVEAYFAVRSMWKKQSPRTGIAGACSESNQNGCFVA
jgi:hypothetical protein